MQGPLKFLTPLFLLIMAALSTASICHADDVTVHNGQDDYFLKPLPAVSESSRSELGTEFIIQPPGSQPDYYHLIADETYDPRVHRSRSNVYYCVARDLDDPQRLNLYQNAGNPANSNWTDIGSIVNASANLADADIMVLSMINRLYVVYTVGNSSVEIFGCRPDNPGINRFVTITTASNLSKCTITSNDYNFPNNPWLYTCWKQGSGAKAAISFDGGFEWSVATVADSDVVEMYTGNSMEWCADSMIVAVYYRDTDNAGIVSRCWANLTLNSFSPRTALTDLYNIGGIATYLNTVLVMGTRGDLDDGNVTYAYSTNNGWSWSSAYNFEEDLDQKWPSVTSNYQGVYSLYYTTIDWENEDGWMYAKRNTYNNLGGSWSSLPTYAYGYDNAICSACISEGATPTYGGAYCYDAYSNKSSRFAWAGTLDEGDGRVVGEPRNLLVKGPQDQAVTDFSLTNAPNPFNSSTSIGFILPEAGFVRLTVYDLTGRQVANLQNGNLNAGNHRVDFQPEAMTAGVYLYRLETGQTSVTKKMIYLK
jgi:hypothetical protein